MTVGIRPAFASKGELRGLFLLFLPVLGTTFSNYLFLLVEKLFLARVSPHAMEAAINASYVCQIFQATTVALVMMAQVFVGRCHGAKQWSAIGPGIWQFIWFSFLSMLITVPGSLLYGKWYFQGTEIATTALPYFYLFVGMNFIYPLGAVLSCFYLGQGKTRLVLLANLGAQIVKIGLAYLLIFGCGTWVSSYGIMGGAISTVSAQGMFCLVLGGVFLSRQHREFFHSHQWRFQLALFWECIYPGLLRAMNRILNFTSWGAIAHLMVAKGGDYLLMLSIGGTLSLFLPFLFEAICQAHTTIVSYLVGAKNYDFLFRSARSGLLLVFLMITLMSIPLLGFPALTFQWLFPHVILDSGTVRILFFGVWMSFAGLTICAIPLSYILAFKDMKFSFFMGIVNWVNGYLLMVFFIEKMQISAVQFWLALSAMHATTALLYFLRMYVLCKRAISNEWKLAQRVSIN